MTMSWYQIVICLYIKKIIKIYTYLIRYVCSKGSMAMTGKRAPLFFCTTSKHQVTTLYCSGNNEFVQEELSVLNGMNNLFYVCSSLLLLWYIQSKVNRLSTDYLWHTTTISLLKFTIYYSVWEYFAMLKCLTGW